MPTSIGAPVQVLRTLLLIQLFANVPGKTAEYGPSACATATHADIQDSIPGSGLWPGAALAITVNQQMRDLYGSFK